MASEKRPAAADPATPQASSSSAQTDQPTSIHREDESDAPVGKREASSYPGSYRPSDAQSTSYASTTGPIHDYNTGISDDPAGYADEVEELPAYSETLGTIEDDVAGQGTQASIADDGRVNINIDQSNHRLSTLLTPALQSQYNFAQADEPLPPPYIPPSLGGDASEIPPPQMNVVIHVVGSRGDVQPFVALGKLLKDTYGHRVRLATHPVFRAFVEENGLEFFSIGGDPAELMAFMVKNPGLMPGFDVLRSGDIGSRRRGIAEMIKGCWRSCIETGDGFGVEASDKTVEDWMSNDASSIASNDPMAKPFVADAIIANPPSFAHIHCAERLGIPLHMMFTMPWSPTQQFPHPLANIQSSNAETTINNYMSYALVDMLTWQGLGDVINRFRKNSLGLEPISLMWAPGMLQRMKIPYTYCWSPALIPKPKDWANFLTISGFFFLNLASNYTPEPDLAEFLRSGPPPVYIGFGSIVVDDPDAMTKLIFDAVKMTGQRALVSKGWGGFGADQLGIPDGVFMLGNCPHDWLFKQVSCVVHHGGAGTTAAGIAAGRPTVVVPFFGDQPFWGAMVARAGAGPDPIHHKDLNADNLAAAINKCLEPASLERANELSEKIATEKGTDKGAQYFHQMLALDNMRCSLAPHRIGAWRVKRTAVRLSTLAATVLIQEKELTFDELKLHRPKEYETDGGPWDPVTGGASAIMGTMSTMMMGVADFPIETLKGLGIHPDAAKKRKEEKEAAKAQLHAASTDTLTETKTLDRPSVESDSKSFRNDSISKPSNRTPTIGLNDSTDNITRVTSPESVSGVQTPSSERANFLAQAMRQHSGSKSRPSSPAREHSESRGSGFGTPGRSNTQQSSVGGSGSSSFGIEPAIGTTKGIGRMVGAGVKAPLDFTMAISKGFHNASRLYGEEPRQVDKVTGFQSGMAVGAKEFGRGIFDGITGLAKDPIKGGKKDGFAGFTKGIGKGLIGSFLKPGAATFAIPAYTMKGIYMEFSKKFGPNIDNYIFAARVAQGYDDVGRSTPEERNDILVRWRCISKSVKKKKNPGKDQLDGLQALLDKHKEKRRVLIRNKEQSTSSVPSAANTYISQRGVQTGYSANNASSASDGGSLYAAYRPSGSASRAYSTTGPTSPDSLSPNNNLTHSQTYPDPNRIPNSPSHPGIPELPAYRDLSGSQTTFAGEKDQSRREFSHSMPQTPIPGPSDDQVMERALQASITEMQRQRDLQSPGEEEDEEAMLQRAIAASMAEASASGASEQEQRELEEVMRKSIHETTARKKVARMKRVRSSDSEWESDSDESFEDVSSAQVREEEELRRAMVASTQDRLEGDTAWEEQRRREEIELAEVLQQSKNDVEARGAADPNDEERRREEAELAEVLQQSAADEEAKRREKEEEEREEEAVLEYIKQESLKEAEAQRRARTGMGGLGMGGESSGSGAGP
ncbi:UDP-Glycosyltransferase/glycogen phosphorylase [Pseudovirgaria hyperparasitica]|uniref:UDP-Glycosyltransferase/glycogen phosphorylase n=1 Tax=Pseudovirgaria hyperparasitica TaxID=470096 RepID=A0A6A6WA04_9PEZI|nr:UDP-Glycosyltransferase/glycogen phosphorylase [Pseudovirgaria hyperparasitica]KAF2758716.1 UDP-Glycosyltransferase/glycogen phosphorylase [Pseudovirgaria hyperparasitica]